MKEQILKIMEEKQLSPAQFADILGIQRPRLSHILNERNKPGYDFILSLLEKFSDIDATWLITGKGNMYKQKSDSIKEEEQDKNLFSSKLLDKESKKDNITHTENSNESKNINELTNVNNIEKIVIFYTNKKFTEYKPQ